MISTMTGACRTPSPAAEAAAGLILGVLAVVLSSATASAVTATGTARDCVDPCLQAARGTRLDCGSSAAGDFRDTLDGCVDLDPGCVAACRAQRQDCRDDTSLGAELAACELEEAGAKERCRNEFRPGSIRRAFCIDQARVRGFRCRRQAERSLKHELRACASAFVGCTEECLPGSPPGGPDSCRARARDAFDAARTLCRTSFRVTTGGCLARDITCVQDCVAARDACEAASRANLDAAIAACNAEREAGLAACRSANPDGGQALEDCEDAVWANALGCREAAVQAALPGFEACAAAYAGCVRACPPA
jgi:hypothetical protein